MKSGVIDLSDIRLILRLFSTDKAFVVYQCIPLIVANNADRAKISKNQTIDEGLIAPN